VAVVVALERAVAMRVAGAKVVVVAVAVEWCVAIAVAVHGGEGGEVGSFNSIFQILSLHT
jgi:hypothetical protein